MKSICVMFLYFLFDRGLSVILHSETLSFIYAALSKVFTCYVLLRAFASHPNKIVIKVVSALTLILLALLFSTVVNSGVVRRCFLMTYPLIAMGALMAWQCSNLKHAKLFIQSIAGLYFILVTINFLFLVFDPTHFTNLQTGELSYFLGGENHVGYPLMKGLIFMLLNSYYQNDKKWLFIYIIVQIATILIIFSGSNVVGLACMLFLMFPGVIRRKMNRVSLNRLLFMLFFFFSILIVMGNLMFVLESPLVAYVVEDLLDKNLTLTNRTVIWVMVVSGFLNSPIIGNGVRETVNLFYIHERYTQGYMSAHNQILQTLYESGLLYFVAAIPLTYMVNKSLKSQDPFVGVVIKAGIISVLVMFMAEAPGMDKIIDLFILGLVLPSKVCNLGSRYANVKVLLR